MQKLKNIIILFFFIIITNCGYTPLLNSENLKFNISDLTFEGDRKINSYISTNLKKYQNNDDATKNYSIKISSYYKKNVINKDKQGNPKNYNIQIESILGIALDDKNEISKTFTRNISLSAQSKKIKERELEKKYKKNLANLIGQDIIFFLINQ